MTEHYELIKNIYNEREKGYGFILLIGNGLSVMSGIPTTREIQEYLYYCLRQAFDREWNPRLSKWPESKQLREKDSEEQDGKMIEWIKKVVEKISNHHLINRDYIYWEAIGALADWRTALQFLSRLEIRDNKKVFLSKPDNRVIDSFFFHVTKDKKPNVGHLMLGHLADALRVRTFLTTNFDSLLEDAFHQLDIPLSTFNVHQNAELPSESLVLAQRSVVKLHGGPYGLRADFTLDEIPSESDKETFCRYFSNQNGNISPETRKHHLLVLGVSGNDRRTINMIRFALKNITDLKVFWICHTKNGEQEIKGKFQEEHSDRVQTTVHVDNGLFLIQLYQKLYLSPPPGRMDFPAFWPMPPSPYENTPGSNAEKEFGKEQKNISKMIDNAINNEKSSSVIIYGKPGLTSLAAATADEFAQYHECIWLTLDVYYEWNDFFLALVDIISWRLGIAPVTLPTSPNDKEICRNRLEHLLKYTDRKVIVFLNDREGDGIQTKWSTESLTLFSIVILESAIKNLTFVVLSPQEQEDKVIAVYNKNSVRYCIEKKVINFNAKGIAKQVADFINTEKHTEIKERKRRFVFALTLFEHAAYLPALCSWGLIKAPRQFSSKPDNDTERSKMRDDWLETLKEKGAVRYNAGGFVWMHKGVRNALRERLMKEMKGYQAECHQGIADWYVKLYRSSNDPLAALESVKHRLLCVKYADDLDNDAGCGSNEYLKRTALIEAGVTLQLAKERLLSYGYHNAAISRISEVLQTIEGFHLEKQSSYITEVRRFKNHCHELLRDFMREVAHFTEAIKHNNSIQKLTSYPDTQEDTEEIQQLYEEIVHLIGYRCYETAESQIREFLEGQGMTGLFSDSRRGSVSYRQIGRDWIKNKSPLPELLQWVIRTLRKLLFLEMLMAQKHQLLEEITQGDSDEHRSKRLSYLKQGEAIYILATELMRNVDNPDFLQTENTYVRTDYGVLLGNKKRFREAHRRLNEAYGYLTQSSKRNDRTPWAVLYLRRAEVDLQQAQACLRDETPKRTTKLQKAQGYLDDVYCALEQVELNLKGHRKNIWWRTWMCELQVTLCIYLSQTANLCKQPHRRRGRHEPLACSCCSYEGQWCLEIMKDGMELIQVDPLRQAKLTWLFLEFLNHSKLGRNKVCIDLVGKAYRHLNEIYNVRKKEASYPIEPDLRVYIEAVIEKTTKWISNSKAGSPSESSLSTSTKPKSTQTGSKTSPKSKTKILDISKKKGKTPSLYDILGKKNR